MSTYHAVRLMEDGRRDRLWCALWQFRFRDQIGADDCVLDMGCGYGNFINQVVAKRRIAIDQWGGCRLHLDGAVEAVVGDVTDLGFLADGSVDFAFASNLFEHLPQAGLARVLEQLRTKLSRTGTLTLVQPNYRYAFREYFDDYTHLTVYSHVSLADLVRSHGFEILELQPRFLPLTIKSSLPVSPWLIRAYLASPWKPLGKQMLLRARPVRQPAG